MGKKFDFEDITLLPNFSYVNSRSDCDTSVKFGGYRFKLPVIPANMESVINEELAHKLAKEGYFYILHRFDVDVTNFIYSFIQFGVPFFILFALSFNAVDFFKNALLFTFFLRCLKFVF